MTLLLEPWHWVVFGVILMLAELVLPAFAALWFGLAALCVALLAWLLPGLSPAAQIVLWLLLSIGCTVAWFKWIKPLSIDKTKAGLSREATIGQVGMVIQTHLSHEHIKVRFPMPVLGADEWQCRCLSPVAVGDRVRVIDILGNDLLVQPHSSQPRDKNLCL